MISKLKLYLELRILANSKLDILNVLRLNFKKLFYLHVKKGIEIISDRSYTLHSAEHAHYNWRAAVNILFHTVMYHENAISFSCSCKVRLCKAENSSPPLLQFCVSLSMNKLTLSVSSLVLCIHTRY